MASTVNAAHAAMAAPRQPGFNSLPLARWLGSLSGIGTTASMPNLAERLGQWMDWTDAIALSSALNGLPQASTAPVVPSPARSAHDACQQVRNELIRAIELDAPLRADLAEPTPLPAHPTFGACRAHCRALQRKMDMRISALRAEVRAVLAVKSPELAQLAALDAVLEQALNARQQHLLATLPSLLEQQFNGLRADQQAAFHVQVKSVLLAELDMRMQPIEGLLAAFGPAPTRNP